MPTAAVTAPDAPSGSTSLRDRLLNIFVAPGEVFEEVVASPRSTGDWRLPVLLNCLAGIVLFLVVAARSPVAPGTDGEGQSTLTSSVSATPPGAAAAPFGDAGSEAAARLVGPSAIVAVNFAGTFWSALVLWLAGRLFLKTRFPFLKTVEIAGLTTVILALGTVVTTLLVWVTGDGFARPAMSLLVGEFNPANKFHQALAAMNFFHVWMAAVLSIGLAKLSDVTAKEAAVWVFGYWIVLRLALCSFSNCSVDFLSD